MYYLFILFICFFIFYIKKETFIVPSQFTQWTILNQTQQYITFQRNDISNNKIEQSIREWTGTLPCSKPCNQGVQYKTIENPNDPTIIIRSSLTYPCNTMSCSKPQVSLWTKSAEHHTQLLYTRQCINDPYCSPLYNDISLNMIVPLNNGTCSKICGGGEFYKFGFNPNNNQIVYSDNSYPCNTQPCTDITSFSNWKFDSTRSDLEYGSYYRDCSDNNTGACSLLKSTEIRQKLPWLLTLPCPKMCNINNDLISTYKTGFSPDKKFQLSSKFICNSISCPQNILYSNSELVSNVTNQNQLVSPNNRYQLVMNNDGNLILYTLNAYIVWNSGSATGTTNSPYILTLHKSGKLEILNKNNSSIKVLYQGNSLKNEFFKLILQDDRNLVLYDANNTKVWATGTDQGYKHTTDTNFAISTNARCGIIVDGKTLRCPDGKCCSYNWCNNPGTVCMGGCCGSNYDGNF